MHSVQGTAWKALSFSLNNTEQQAIDAHGMTDLKKVSSSKDSILADFLFTIAKTDRGIELKGIKETAWTEFSFLLSENGKQVIDHNGITTVN